MPATVAVLLAAQLVPPARAYETRKTSVLTSVTASEVASMLADADHEAIVKVDSDGDPLLSVKSPEFSYQVLFYECVELRCDALQFRAWWELPGTFSADVMNGFNREFRLGRAYLDDEGSPTLELVLELTGGVTPDQLVYQHGRFMASGKAFKKHLSKARAAR